MWIKWLSIAALCLMSIVIVAALWGSHEWREETRAAVRSLPRAADAGADFQAEDLEGLPPPVARYFRAVLRPGQPMVRGATVQWEGQFRTERRDDAWRPFDAKQVFVARPPGLVWDATIRMAPGFAVRVRDSYIAGHGRMQAKLFGIVPVVDAHGARELDTGALQRYLGEAVWFPTALLPRQGVTWTPLTENSALATLVDGSTSVSLEFRFDASDRVVSIYTPARFRELNGAFVSTPWQARLISYAEHGGMLVPTEGEVEWVIDGQSFPYWRGRLKMVRYELRS